MNAERSLAAPVALAPPGPPAAGGEFPALPGNLAGLAALPRSAPLDAPTLAAILGRCEKSVARMWRRGELPPPFKLGARHYWTAGAILDCFGELQAAALRPAKNFGKSGKKT